MFRAPASSGCSPSNVWVARGLREAGLEVRASLTTEGLMAQLRVLAK